MHVAAYHGAILDRDAGTNDGYVSVTNHPLPITAHAADLNRFILSHASAVFIIIPLSLMTGNWAYFPVQERATHALHVQQLTGLSPAMYWLGNYVYDFACYSVVVGTLMIGLVLSNSSLAEGEFATVTIILFALYGLAMIPFSYVLSLLFKNPSNSQIGVAAINFVFGFVLYTVVKLMNVGTNNVDDSIAELYLRPICNLHPAFVFATGLTDASWWAYENKWMGHNYSPFEMGIAGDDILLLLQKHVPGYIALLLVVAYIQEGRYFTRLRNAATEHVRPAIATARRAWAGDTAGVFAWARPSVPDVEMRASLFHNAAPDPLSPENEGVGPRVLAERAAVEELDAAKARGDAAALRRSELSVAWVLSKLTKVHSASSTPAVDGLNLLVPRRQVFGFLGVNGAGKSTTLRMLTGASMPTSGNATVGGKSVVTDLSHARRAIGYCPQAR